MTYVYFENMMKKDFIDFFKPTPAIMSRAEWWKKMEKYVNFAGVNPPPSSIRLCPAINDSINFGYIIYTQADIFISENNNDIEWNCSQNMLIEEYGTNFISSHPIDQMQNYVPPPGFSVVPFNIHCGFLIRTDPGHSIWVTHPMHRNDLPFRTVDAVIDSDNFGLSDALPIFIKKQFSGIIPAGTPLGQIIPFKREDYEAKFVDFDLEKMNNQRLSLLKHFRNRYKKNFWQRKIFK